MKKEDIKDLLFLFGIALLLLLMSLAITNPLMAWFLKWIFRIGFILFVIVIIITIINIIVAYIKNRKKKNNNSDDNNINPKTS